MILCLLLWNPLVCIQTVCNSICSCTAKAQRCASGLLVNFMLSPKLQLHITFFFILLLFSSKCKISNTRNVTECWTERFHQKSGRPWIHKYTIISPLALSVFQIIKLSSGQTNMGGLWTTKEWSLSPIKKRTSKQKI